MKKIIFLTIFALFSISCLFAQLSLVRLDDGSTIENNAILTFNTEYNLDFVLTNTGGDEIEVYLEALSIDRPSGSMMEWCFGEECIDDMEVGARYPTGGPFVMESGASTPNGNHFLHRLNGTTEIATYVLKFYDATNPDNYIQFTYKYDESSAIEELNSKSKISIYPNPSKNFLYIQCNDLGKNYQISIRNIIGKEIKVIDVDNSKETVKIQTDDLSSGIYLYSIIADGEFIETKKLIINK